MAVKDDSFPHHTSHKHKGFKCRHLKALANGIKGEIWEAEARPFTFIPSFRGKEKADLSEHKAGSCQYPCCRVDG